MMPVLNRAILAHAPQYARYLAAARAGLRGQGSWKEWCHVGVLTPDLAFIANVSHGGATALGWTAWSGWRGVVRQGDARRIGTGGLASCGIEMMPEAGKLSLQVEQPEAAMAASLELSFPGDALVVAGAPMGSGVFEWLALPLALANGWIRLGQRRIDVCDAPAYHDQNWGTWRWGDDLSWQWGFTTRIADHQVVFTRMLDRRRLREADRRVIVWRGGRLARVFSGSEVEVVTEGRFRGPAVPLFPPVLRLLDGGSGSDVPRLIALRARHGDDSLSIEFAPERVAVVGVPNEVDLGWTGIQEVVGRATILGVIGHARFAGDASALFELVHGA